MENKQLILDSLCSALQLTRDQADLEALEYKAYRTVSVNVPISVVIFFSRFSVDDKVTRGVSVKTADNVE